MARLDQQRQEEQEPVRMDWCQKRLEELGYEVTRPNDRQLNFQYKGSLIRLYPYSGWHTGKTIKDGRGFNNLMSQISD